MYTPELLAFVQPLSNPIPFSRACSFQAELPTYPFFNKHRHFFNYRSKRSYGSRSVAVRMNAEKADSAKVFKKVGSANLDWPNIGFAYRPTNSNVRCVYKDGAWGPIEVHTDPNISIPLGSTALNYGQSAFEGLKACCGPDGRVRLFRPHANAERLQSSADRLLMPKVPTDLFLEVCAKAVRNNIEFVPPYGTGGSLYLRPILIGSGIKIGLAPAEEYTFVVIVTPVGDYYKGGMSPVTALIMEGFDRAAPLGIGACKTGGNYAADLFPNVLTKKKGFPINLYLDPLKHAYIEEFGTSNFCAIQIDEQGTPKYITPDSSSVLQSITNMSLMHLAKEAGFIVEKRKIAWQEIATFDEAAACGTAVVITPVTRFNYQGKEITVKSDPDKVGPKFKMLYDRLRNIQYGEAEDPYHWTYEVSLQ